MPAIAFPPSLASAYQETALHPSATGQSVLRPAPTAASTQASLGIPWGTDQDRISTNTRPSPDKWDELTNVNTGQDQTIIQGPPPEEPVSELISVIPTNPSVATG